MSVGITWLILLFSFNPHSFLSNIKNDLLLKNQKLNLYVIYDEHL